MKTHTLTNPKTETSGKSYAEAPNLENNFMCNPSKNSLI